MLERLNHFFTNVAILLAFGGSFAYFASTSGIPGISHLGGSFGILMGAIFMADYNRKRKIIAELCQKADKSFSEIIKKSPGLTAVNKFMNGKDGKVRPLDDLEAAAAIDQIAQHAEASLDFYCLMMMVWRANLEYHKNHEVIDAYSNALKTITIKKVRVV